MAGRLGPGTALGILMVILAAVGDAGWAAQVVEAVIDVAENGFATITMTIAYNQTEVLVTVPTLGRPETFTIKATASDGSLVPFTTSGDQLILNVAGAPPPVKLQYYTAALTAKSGRLWNISLQLTETVLLKLPPGAVLIGISGVPEDIAKIENRIHLTLSPGPWQVSYFLIPEATGAPPSPGINPLWLLAALAVAGGAAGYALFARRKRSLVLRPDDRRILEYISAVGGQAYESDIVRELNLPKSTVWRAVRRLSQANLVTIVREGNRVKVVRK